MSGSGTSAVPACCVHCGQAIRTAQAFWYWPPEGTCAERLHTACTLAWLARVGEPVVVRLVAREEDTP